MDKNKSVYKLKDFPHVYWINLDDKEDRRQFMENQFAYWEVENTRISAYDGREDDLSDILQVSIMITCPLVRSDVLPLILKQSNTGWRTPTMSML